MSDRARTDSSNTPGPGALSRSRVRPAAAPSPWRWTAACSAMVAAAAHLPVTPEHLREAPYMGALFAGFALAALYGAAALLLDDTDARYALLGVLCAAAVLTYAATRLVAFPELGDDVGNWTEPLGVLSVVTELITVAACAVALHERRHP